MHALKPTNDDDGHDVIAANDNAPQTKIQSNPGTSVTEDSVAFIFANAYRDTLRYCHSTGAWFEWTGSHWQRNEVGLAAHHVRVMARDLSNGLSPKALASIRKRSFASGVEKFAQNDPTFAVTHAAWDQDTFLLGTPDGTVDLRSGVLRHADPGDRITKLTSVVPSSKPDCPLWLRFLEEATCGDAGHGSWIASNA